MAKGVQLPEYEKPPVIEVVCGIRFEPLPEFRVGHFGLFWSELRGDFPKCENAPPLGLAPDMVDMSAGVIMPRAWLISESEEFLIQLQHNRFLFNWRRRSDDAEYPRYVSIIRSFWDRLEQFEQFCNRERLGDVVPVEMELTYINHIPCEDGPATAKHLGTIVPDAAWNAPAHAFLPEPSVMAWRADFDMPHQAGRLSAKLNPAHRNRDGTAIVVLEMSARGPGVETRTSQRQWFDLAHEWVVAGFADLTSDQVQRNLWGMHA